MSEARLRDWNGDYLHIQSTMLPKTVDSNMSPVLTFTLENYDGSVDLKLKKVRELIEFCQAWIDGEH